MTQHTSDDVEIVVLICAWPEWKSVREHLPDALYHPSPFGEWCRDNPDVGSVKRRVVWFNGGCWKIAAAASAQYAINLWRPRLLVNLGRCGRIEGAVKQDDIILVERTVVYDIREEMGNTEQAIAHYRTQLDLSWLREPSPIPVICGVVATAEHDLVPQELSVLRRKYKAVAADWEFGAIAYVAAHNKVPCLILRGVTDVVGPHGNPAYDKPKLYFMNARKVMKRLILSLPQWLAGADELL